jgi:electron transfer flavoprotein alpha/beta subunit
MGKLIVICFLKVVIIMVRIRVNKGDKETNREEVDIETMSEM